MHYCNTYRILRLRIYTVPSSLYNAIPVHMTPIWWIARDSNPEMPEAPDLQSGDAVPSRRAIHINR